MIFFGKIKLKFARPDMNTLMGWGSQAFPRVKGNFWYEYCDVLQGYGDYLKF
jgi:hypothetical protein